MCGLLCGSPVEWRRAVTVRRIGVVRAPRDARGPACVPRLIGMAWGEWQGLRCSTCLWVASRQRLMLLATPFAVASCLDVVVAGHGSAGESHSALQDTATRTPSGVVLHLGGVITVLPHSLHEPDMGAAIRCSRGAPTVSWWRSRRWSAWLSY